jgi:hypothetical protein
MWIIQINDGFCVWEFEFESNGGNCIQDVVNAITDRTGLRKVRERFVNRPIHIEKKLEVKSKFHALFGNEIVDDYVVGDNVNNSRCTND